jgi:hypothetical protein
MPPGTDYWPYPQWAWSESTYIPIARQGNSIQKDNLPMNTKIISHSTLIRRVNHALSFGGFVIKKTHKQDICRENFGEYYCLDFCDGIVTDKNIDLESYARNMEVLQDWEVLDQ